MKTLNYCLGIGLVLIMVSPVGVQASLTPGVTANYGAFTASSVLYSNVNEHTTYGAYNAPTTGGDSLNFDPSGLMSESLSSESGLIVNDAYLGFHVWAKDGNHIEALDFSEGGDFSVYGSGTDSTFIGVVANFWVDIHAVGGVAINPIQDTFSITNFSPNTSSMFGNDTGFHLLDTDGAAFGTIWDGSIHIDLEEMLEGSGYSNVTHVSVTLDNWLFASSEAGTYASIQKKDANAFSVTAVVPEPASLVLILGTTSLFAFIRRRFVG